MRMKLFPDGQSAGVFRGFREGGMEFHADLALPYKQDLQNVPMHGQFLLVQLETPDEAVLGRIASLSSEGRLSSRSGEEFNIRAAQEGRQIPEDIREQYLRYHVNIRVLGVLRAATQGLNFVASHRRIPHVGSPVAFPSHDVLKEIVGHNVKGSTIGHFALGEYFYGPFDEATEDWMQVQPEEVRINFAVDNLVARRTFIFARAGFGKSNLNKLLFSSLYSETPTVEKRLNRRVPVGTILFDPDGEYFWPDDKGRPGLCDVPELKDNVVVFTPRAAPSPFYGSFVAGGIKLDIRRLRPSDVVAIALSQERQEQQNVLKLRSLSQANWEQLVNLVYSEGFNASLDQMRELLGLEHGQDAELLAARANATRIVKTLHDPASQLMDMLIKALSDGKLCIVDVSQLAGSSALQLSAVILRRIFDRNQDEFTAAHPKTIPTIAVVEEAQAVLNERTSAAATYVQWVKEGRKYDLGAVLVTQQPGSIPNEILSQGDNWFLFHVLSAGDLSNIRAANAHFGQDLLSSLLNEPIAGQGIFWSSVGGKPYPVPLRALSFEAKYQILDPAYNLAAVQSYASRLRERFSGIVYTKPDAPVATGVTSIVDGVANYMDGSEGMPADNLKAIETRAAEALRESEHIEKLHSDGFPWGGLNAFVEEHVPEDWDDRSTVAYNLVPKVLNELFGPQGEAWESFTPDGRKTRWVRVMRKS